MTTDILSCKLQKTQPVNLGLMRSTNWKRFELAFTFQNFKIAGRHSVKTLLERFYTVTTIVDTVFSLSQMFTAKVFLLVMIKLCALLVELTFS